MILVCAATSVEYDACAAGIAAASHDRAARFEMLRVGVGGAHAERALRERLAAKKSPPSRVLSVGFAGALSEDLAIGAWVTAARIYKWTHATGKAEVVGDAVPLASAEAMVSCDVVSVERLAGASSEVQIFSEDARARGNAAIVDMESAALAALANAGGIPFSVARVVSDSPSHPLPEFLSPFTDAMAGGSGKSRALSVARGIGSALRDPRGVARVVSEGREWQKTLERGWRVIAETLESG